MRSLRILIGGLFALGLIFGVATPGGAQTPEVDPCVGMPESRLKDGALAKIIELNDPRFPGGYFKATPSHLGPVLRYLSVGTVVSVHDQPACDAEGERWWKVKLGPLDGWMVETSGDRYFLEPFEGEAPSPLPTTIEPLLLCVRPVLPDPNAEPTPGGTPGVPVLRIVYGGEDGSVGYSDNAGAVRILAKFDPPPLSVDLSPDGSAAIVTNFNGLYWLDILTGRVVMMADGTTFQMGENMFMRRAWWLPDGTSVAVEIEDTTDDVTSYYIWTMPMNGVGQPFQVDTGAQPRDSVRRTPGRDAVILISANDIALYPKNYVDDSPPLLKYVPRFDDSDARAFLTPAISWTADGKGFNTYIPDSEEAPPEDPVKGRMWYVPLDASDPIDLGKPENVATSDYVIPSPDGKLILLGSGRTWRIQDPGSGEIVQRLPPVRFLFDWTPDSKGVVYTTLEGKASYLGLDGGTSSPLVPRADNLFNISWLPDGTILYVAQGADGKYSFSVKRPNGNPAFVGLTNTIYSYSAAVLPGAPGLAKPPEPCTQ